MKPKLSVLTSILMLFNLTIIYAQTDSAFIMRAISLMNTNETKIPIEKVHLHFDKPYYVAGDDIWFKAYVTVGSLHQLSALSGVLNVELVNFKDSIIQNLKLALLNGIAWGDLLLPDSLASGRYRVRAYTNWMRNAGEEYFFNQIINIGSTSQSLPYPNILQKHPKPIALTNHKSIPLSRKTDVQFFPEGGNLVYGIESKIAFKAIGDNGLGREVSGKIVDGQNHEITKINTRHLGMGEFNFLPEKGMEYLAIITFADGSEKSYKLPLPSFNGYALHVDQSDPFNLYVSVKSGSTIKDSADFIHLIATNGSKVYYAVKAKSANSSFNITIPKNKFPTGLLRLTLFSSSGEPLNERLVFIQNTPLLSLSVQPNANNFNPRAQMKFELKAINAKNEPVLGNFSVAVIDESKVPVEEADETSIFSNLLLTSEIKGYIEKPNYYFMRNDEQTKADLDLLMLTQGYHRFEWKDILNNKPVAPVYEPENSLQISGRVTTLHDKPVSNSKVSMISSSKGFFMIDTITDQNGIFRFKNLIFNDSTKFIIQSKTIKDKKNIKLEIDQQGPTLADNGKRFPNPNNNANDSLSVYLANSKKKIEVEIKYNFGKHTKVLKEVVIKAKKPVSNSSNLNGAGNADHIITAKDMETGCPVMSACLGEKLKGSYVVYDKENIAHPVTYRNGKEVDMKIMLDGMYIEPYLLDLIQPESIESMEILTSSQYTSIYGSEAYDGILLITSKRGVDLDKFKRPNIIAYLPKGFYKARTFYSPKYPVKDELPKLPDLRSTIYWNPNIYTQKEDATFIEYFNADSPGNYRVVIEGIDGEGNLGRLVYKYKLN